MHGSRGKMQIRKHSVGATCGTCYLLPEAETSSLGTSIDSRGTSKRQLTLGIRKDGNGYQADNEQSERPDRTILEV
jgi:hypothetical protein